jgi:hypothetical protein
MKVKLNKELVKKFMFAVGGDMSETCAIAVDNKGDPIAYKDLNKANYFRTMTFHVLELADQEEFLVVNHRNPISQDHYDGFKKLYQEIEE